jgi:TRAP-type C4-dicarboxylate transport system permease small subunit
MRISVAFLTFERILTKIALVASIVMLIVSVSTGFYQVVTRFVIGVPSTWSEITTISLMIWAVLLASGPGFRYGMMMSVDVIHTLIPKKYIIYLELPIAISNLLVMLMLVWLGVELAYKVRFQNMAGLSISIAWTYAALPVGCGFASISILGRIVSLFHDRENMVNPKEVITT